MNAVRRAHPSPSIPFHEPEERSTFNIQRPTSKAGAKRSALDIQSWALNVECFPCGSGAQCVNYSGKSLPVECRGKVEADAVVADREPGFATERKQMIPRRRSAFPSPFNGERIPRTISRIKPLNRVKSSASVLPIRGNEFSLSPGERAGVRGGSFVSAWLKEQLAERSHPSPSIFTPSLY
jgi:hypothetical protein